MNMVYVLELTAYLKVLVFSLIRDNADGRKAGGSGMHTSGIQTYIGLRAYFALIVLIFSLRSLVKCV
jgi:hypothetical protein